MLNNGSRLDVNTLYYFNLLFKYEPVYDRYILDPNNLKLSRLRMVVNKGPLYVR
jgi:hypothetical protein